MARGAMQGGTTKVWVGKLPQTAPWINHCKPSLQELSQLIGIKLLISDF